MGQLAPLGSVSKDECGCLPGHGGEFLLLSRASMHIKRLCAARKGLIGCPQGLLKVFATFFCVKVLVLPRNADGQA